MKGDSPSALAPAPGGAQGLFFLRKFLQNPRDVAAVWPSSRALARAMLAGLALAPGSAVIELGPGTGPFTAAIVELLGPERPQRRYFGIDRDPEFVALLRRRFPGFDFAVADVGQLVALLAARPGLRPQAVISGLPIVAMPRPFAASLLDAVVELLPAGGAFRTFSYLHTVVNPASWWLRGQLRRRFRTFRVRGPVLRNVPPALVFEATR